ncbi:hypothetical protein [Francisella sp. SYW-9]|nr:hypothetical protein [Francisella sp. SYW-9]
MKKINISLILTFILFSISVGDSLCRISSPYPENSSNNTQVHMNLLM